MKYYKCDWCGKEEPGEPATYIKDASWYPGADRKPELYQEKHFCSRDHLWKWFDRNMEEGAFK